MQFEIQSTERRGTTAPFIVAMAVAAVVHAAIGLLGYIAWLVAVPEAVETELVDIEIAPAPPPVEALPEEVATPPKDEDLTPTPGQDPSAASTTPTPTDPTEGFIDAGIDAAPDAPIDAPPDARPDARPKPDARPDAEEMAALDGGVDFDAPDPASVLPDAGVDDGGTDANPDGGTDAAPDDAGVPTVAAVDAGSGDTPSDGGTVAVVGDPGSAGGSNATEAGSGSGSAGSTNEPAVAGAPTTAGTAANLLAYFPKGHLITALIRFDRLRGTEWAAQCEALLQPLPDYQSLFGSRDAKVADTLDTLVISTPSPKDATATTLVAHTHLGRPALRDFLSVSTTVTWSAARGGMMGTRSGNVPKGDQRVILSPFQGWFVLAKPADLGALTGSGSGDIDVVEAKGKLPAWIAGIRKIEAESGSDRGPSLVVTVGLESKRYETKGRDFGLGVESFTTPQRVSLAMELVKQGWLIRGNIRFANEADAAEFVTKVRAVQERIATSTMHQKLMGKAAVRAIANFSFSQKGPRVSYSSSVSIADARQILALAAAYLQSAFGQSP